MVMPEEHYATLPVVDDPPKEWAEEHPEPTDEEISLGNALGKIIDVP